jgi:hypothetical protein
LRNFYRSLTINSKTKRENRDRPCEFSTESSNQNQTCEFQIASFNDALTYAYKYEGLPLDSLIVNSASVDSTKCTPEKYSWLNCYEIKNTQIKLERCVSSFGMNFSYGVDDFTIYKSNLTDRFTIRNFYVTISLTCNYLSITFLFFLFIFKN